MLAERQIFKLRYHVNKYINKNAIKYRLKIQIQESLTQQFH